MFIGFALYGRTVGFAYVWDDSVIFLSNNRLLNDPLSWDLLTVPVLDGSTYIRPFVKLTWWLEFHLFGQYPALSHAINVVIYSLNVLLVYGLANHANRTTAATSPASRTWLPWIAAFVYAVHPVQVEAIAWVSGRFDLLCTTSVLVAVWCYIALPRYPVIQFLSVLSATALGLASKELGIVTPVALICAHLGTQIMREKSLTRSLHSMFARAKMLWLALFLLFFAYFSLRHQIIANIYDEPPSRGIDWSAITALRPLEALRTYASMVLWPFARIDTFHLSTQQPYSLLNIGLNILTGITAFGILLQAIVRRRAWAWWLMASLASISLVLHVIQLSIANNLIQERFLTLPLAFACIALASSRWIVPLQISKFTKKSMACLLAGWLAGLMVTTVAAVPAWKNELILWAIENARQPNNDEISSRYLTGLLTHGELDALRAQLDHLAAKNNGFSVFQQFYKAYLLFLEGDVEAIPYLEGLISVIPKGVDGEIDLQRIRTQTDLVMSTYVVYARALLVFDGDTKGALEALARAEHIASFGMEAHVLYPRATVFYAMEKFDDAGRILGALRGIKHSSGEALRLQMRTDLIRFCEPRNLSQDLSICSRLRTYNLLDLSHELGHED